MASTFASMLHHNLIYESFFIVLRLCGSFRSSTFRMIIKLNSGKKRGESVWLFISG